MRLSHRRDVDHLQRHRSASEVTARARLFSALDPKQFGVEIRRLIEVSHLNIDAKETRHIRYRALLRTCSLCFPGRTLLGRLLFRRHSCSIIVVSECPSKTTR